METLLVAESIGTETKSYSNDFEEKRAQDFNATEGLLNKLDGVDCPLCKNKGQIAIAKKLYEDCDAKVMTLKTCECMKQRKSVRYAQRSGMGELLKSRVNTFVATDNWQQSLKAKVVDYIKNGEGKWLAILGQSGVGKTHLCSAVANVYLSKGIEVRYCVWGLMTKELKHDMFSPSGSREMLSQLQTVPVLYIDDLFKASYNEQDVSLMFDLLNYRYNANLVTIITSERLIGELADIDTAIAGRIKERCGKYLIQLAGADKNYRMKEKQETN